MRKFLKTWFTLGMLSDKFTAISKSVLHEIVTDNLNITNFVPPLGSRNAYVVNKIKRLGSAVTFLTRYSDEGDEVINKIITGDETWVCHESKQSM